MDFSKVDKYGLTHDLIKIGLFNIILHIAMEYQYNEFRDLFGYKFIFQLFFIELGFALFYLFIEPTIKEYWKKKAKKSSSKKSSSKMSSSKKSSSKSSSLVGSTSVTLTK